MKQLSEILKDTSNTAAKTDIVAVGSKGTLTTVDMSRITEKANALIAKPLEKESLLALLKSQMSLSNPVKIETETVYTEWGATFIPTKSRFEPLTDEQKEIGRFVLRQMSRPLSDEALVKLYTRLRLSTKHTKDEVIIEEKMRMAIYCEEMKKFPASVSRDVMTMTYDFFPTLNELICECERSCRLLNVLKEGLR